MATQTKRDYYEVLGVSRTATAEEIKRAFLKMAAEYQAAGKPANIEAVEAFRSVARAYRILSDPEQKHLYDVLGQNALLDQPLSTGYDLDELDRRSTAHGPYDWLYCDPALAKFLDKLMGWD